MINAPCWQNHKKQNLSDKDTNPKLYYKQQVSLCVKSLTISNKKQISNSHPRGKTELLFYSFYWTQYYNIFPYGNVIKEYADKKEGEKCDRGGSVNSLIKMFCYFSGFPDVSGVSFWLAVVSSFLILKICSLSNAILHF